MYMKYEHMYSYIQCTVDVQGIHIHNERMLSSESTTNRTSSVKM